MSFLTLLLRVTTKAFVLLPGSLIPRNHHDFPGGIVVAKECATAEAVRENFGLSREFEVEK
jgi:hypothetical protein